MAGKSWRGTNWLVVVLAAGLYAGAGWQIVAAAMLGGVWLWPSLIALALAWSAFSLLMTADVPGGLVVALTVFAAAATGLSWWWVSG